MIKSLKLTRYVETPSLTEAGDLYKKELLKNSAHAIQAVKDTVSSIPSSPNFSFLYVIGYKEQSTDERIVKIGKTINPQ
jgi:hypothetical protein